MTGSICERNLVGGGGWAGGGYGGGIIILSVLQFCRWHSRVTLTVGEKKIKIK